MVNRNGKKMESSTYCLSISKSWVATLGHIQILNNNENLLATVVPILCCDCNRKWRSRDNLQPFMFFARGEEVIFTFRSLWLITGAESLNDLCQLLSHHMYWPMDCVPLFGDLDRRKNSGFYKNPIPKLMSGKGNSQPQRDWDGWQIACNLPSGDFFFRLIAD